MRVTIDLRPEWITEVTREAFGENGSNDREHDLLVEIFEEVKRGPRTGQRQRRARTINDCFEVLEEIKPIVEGTPPDVELDQNVITKAIQASRELEFARRKLKIDLRSDLGRKIRAWQEWLKANDLPDNMEAR